MNNKDIKFKMPKSNGLDFRSTLNIQFKMRHFLKEIVYFHKRSFFFSSWAIWLLVLFISFTVYGEETLYTSTEESILETKNEIKDKKLQQDNGNSNGNGNGKSNEGQSEEKSKILDRIQNSIQNRVQSSNRIGDRNNGKNNDKSSVLHKRKSAKISKEREVSEEDGETGGGNLPMGGNLPSLYLRRDFKSFKQTASHVVTPKKIQETLPGVFVGDILEAEILHSILAFPNDKSPVVVEVTSKKLFGSRVLGFSRLEPNSKRITIEFLFVTTSGLTFRILGSALTQDGTQGLEGVYHSQEGKLFTGVFLSSMTAAYFDSLVPRTTSVFGEVQKQISPGDAATQGLAAGAIATADEFRKKLAQAPEFSEIQCGASQKIKIKLIILEVGEKI